jgi:hypothetical protein
MREAECRPPEGTPDGWPRPVLPEVLARQRAWLAQIGDGASRYRAALLAAHRRASATPPEDAK